MPENNYYEIIENTRLTDNVFSLTVKCDEIAGKACAGQFLHIKCGDERLLRRPISICDAQDGSVRCVFEVKGEGTRWLSERCRGEWLDILGPLGSGYILPEGSKGGDGSECPEGYEGNIIVIGGGIGVPPMLFAAKSARGGFKAVKGDISSEKVQITAILGFRDAKRLILEDEFEALCDNVIITTDDGSLGYHGAVTAPLAGLLEAGGVNAVLACGPRAMLSAVAGLCSQHDVPCQVSLEERMGCGVGACMVCSCATVIDGKEHMSRVCKDGPIFNADIIAW